MPHLAPPASSTTVLAGDLSCSLLSRKKAYICIEYLLTRPDSVWGWGGDSCKLTPVILTIAM